MVTYSPEVTYMENKKMSTYRLNYQVLEKLDSMSRESGLSKAQIIEAAVIRLYNHCPYGADLRKQYFKEMSTNV